MARGGKRLGAGRPKGSTQRPQLRDYFNEDELLDFIELVKTHMVEDMTILRFVGEQIFGKAVQPISGDPVDRTPIPILHVQRNDGDPKGSRTT
jgi:hypothetical protein